MNSTAGGEEFQDAELHMLVRLLEMTCEELKVFGMSRLSAPHAAYIMWIFGFDAVSM